MPKSESKQIPIAEELLTTPLSPPEQVKLKGTRCRSCGEVFFGRRVACENCSGQDMEQVVLGTTGTLYTYTVVEHRPPGDYKGPDNPFVPFGVGLVELTGGPRIVAPLTENKALKIGMKLELVVDKLFQDENGNDVMSFKFKPAA